LELRPQALAHEACNPLERAMDSYLSVHAIARTRVTIMQ
jgi:hypothetical protein